MMSQVHSDSDQSVKDPVRFNHIDLLKHLSCRLDSLPGLSDVQPETPPSKKTSSDRPAAILVPLLLANSEWHILMTKRTVNLAHHGGQVSFPGGKMEPFDTSPVETALREAFEEVNLAPSSVQVAGFLKKVRSPAKFVVQPVVGIVAGNNVFDKLVSNPAEVDLMFTLPLSHLRNPDNFRLVPRKTNGRRNDYWVVKHDQHHIWGLSAKVLNDLHQRVYKPI